MMISSAFIFVPRRRIFFVRNTNPNEITVLQVEYLDRLQRYINN